MDEEPRHFLPDKAIAGFYAPESAMWICSKLGFFSMVKKGEPETWQIRARCEGDLRELLAASGLTSEVIPTPKGDYAFRVVVDEAGLLRVYAMLAESIDYPNFKSVDIRLIAKWQGHSDARLILSRYGAYFDAEHEQNALAKLGNAVSQK